MLKQLNILTMKNYFFDLLDQVTPATDEHKEFLNVFLGGLTLFCITFGSLVSLLILMP